MENGLGEVMEESEVDSRSKAQEQTTNGRHHWLNGNSTHFYTRLCQKKLLHSNLKGIYTKYLPGPPFVPKGGLVVVKGWIYKRDKIPGSQKLEKIQCVAFF